MRLLPILFLLGYSVIGAGQDVIPKPAELTVQNGKFYLQSQTGVVAGTELKNEASFITAELKKYTNVTHRIVSPALARRLSFRGGIFLSLDPSLPKGQHHLRVDPQNVVISGYDAEAVFHGIQSFFQLVPAEKIGGLLPIPALSLTDTSPGTVRRVKLDLARHLYPTADLKKFIDLLAFHKLNCLSLHLSDDQGWRIESKKFPKLTAIGSLRKSTPPYGDRHGSNGEEYGGHYTQENIRDLVAHAKSRHVQLVPVISLPARVSPLLAAYPEWGNDDLEDYTPTVRSDWNVSPHLLAPKPDTFKALDTLLEEISTLFDSAVIGIHDDAPSLAEWKNSPSAQAFIQKNKLKNPAGLHQYFLTYLAQSAEKLNRKIILESKAPAALRLDHYQRTAALELEEESTREAVGGLLTVRDTYQAHASAAVLWTPFMHEWSKVEYMAFPRLAAFAETSWTPQKNRSFDDFLKRLTNLLAHYKKRGVNAATPFEAPKRAALHGTVITTNLGHYLKHWPEALFDGQKETFFWSNRALEKGDHITLIFPEAIEGDIKVATDGLAGVETGGAALADGVLEVSPDGKNWDPLAKFFDGLATLTAPVGTRGLRIRATAKQREPLIIHEIVLSKPLTPMVLKEKRDIIIGSTTEGKEVTREITFEANFSGHPELRQKVAACREHYFSLWPRIGTLLGTVQRADSPASFTLKIDPDQFAKASQEEVEAKFIADLVAHLQTYQPGSPDWFTTGLQALIRNREIPSARPKRAPKKTNAVTGGNASAAFLTWVGQTYGEFALTSVSTTCLSKYDPRHWEITTGLTLDKLVAEYQK